MILADKIIRLRKKNGWSQEELAEKMQVSRQVGKYAKVLKEGEFAPQEKRRSPIKERISAVYWLSATTIFLSWSFWTNAWRSTWIVWPIAGVLFAVVMCISNLLIDREK